MSCLSFLSNIFCSQPLALSLAEDEQCFSAIEGEADAVEVDADTLLQDACIPAMIPWSPSTSRQGQPLLPSELMEDQSAYYSVSSSIATDSTFDPDCLLDSPIDEEAFYVTNMDEAAAFLDQNATASMKNGGPAPMSRRWSLSSVDSEVDTPSSATLSASSAASTPPPATPDLVPVTAFLMGKRNEHGLGLFFPRKSALPELVSVESDRFGRRKTMLGM